MEQAKKHIFWIVLGVLLVVAVIASFFITGPVRTENEERVRNIKQRIGELKKRLQAVKNRRWIDRAKEEQEMIQKEEKETHKFLLESDFTRLFSKDRNDPDSGEEVDPALWKDRYKEELSLLRQALRTAQVLPGSRAFHTRLDEWGDRVPGRTEMEVANKEFCILKDLCDIVLKTKDERDRVRVHRLIQIGFPGVAEYQQASFDPEGKAGDEASVKRKKIRDTYLPIPVVVIVDMDSKYVEKFLTAIVSSPWRYTMHTCEIVRISPDQGEKDRGGPGGPGGPGGGAKPEDISKERKDLFENTTVRVKLYLEALDFSVLKQALQKKAAGESEG